MDPYSQNGTASIINKSGNNVKYFLHLRKKLRRPAGPPGRKSGLTKNKNMVEWWQDITRSILWKGPTCPMKEFIVGTNDAGQRLDRWLAKTLPLLPAPLAQKYIRLKR